MEIAKTNENKETEKHQMIDEYNRDIILYESIDMYSCPDFPSLLAHSVPPFTVNVPFMCQKCARCCTRGYPDHQYGANTQDIINHLGVSENEFRKILYSEETLEGSNLTPCCFLKDNLCSIYPVRPECCREYNGRTQLDWGCPARKRQEEISDCIMKGHLGWITEHEGLRMGNRGSGMWEKFFRIDDIDDIKEAHVSGDPPTKEEWNKVWRRFQMMKPSEEEAKLFLALNPISKIYGETEPQGPISTHGGD